MKRNKYNADAGWGACGHYHRSKVEREHCIELSLRKDAGEIVGFEFEKRYTFEVNGKVAGHHKPDFTVTGNDGNQWVEEVKGGRATMGSHFRLCRALFEILFPDIPYNVIMRKAGKPIYGNIQASQRGNC